MELKCSEHKDTLIIDLPVIKERDGSVNVVYKNKNLYLGRKSYGGFICLLSSSMRYPKYQGGFMTLYVRKEEKLSAVLERMGV